jgi:hypothetical protein
MQFYAYLYRDTNGKPIYVGKGCGRRVKHHIYAKTKLGDILREYKADGYIIEPIIYPCLDEELAFFVEEELIRKYGRINIGTGSLLNITSGGQGTSGRKQSQETKDKISKSQKKNTANKRNYGKKHSDETKQLISKKAIGNKNGEGNKGKTQIAWNKGIPSMFKGILRSEETKLKQRKPRTEEGKRNNLLAQQKRWRKYYANK